MVDTLNISNAISASTPQVIAGTAASVPSAQAVQAPQQPQQDSVEVSDAARNALLDDILSSIASRPSLESTLSREGGFVVVRITNTGNGQVFQIPSERLLEYNIEQREELFNQFAAQILGS